jgi:hypothetical protein
MKYMKEERLDIGCRIFEREITLQQALDEYGITERTATRYKSNGQRPEICQPVCHSE